MTKDSFVIRNASVTNGGERSETDVWVISQHALKHRKRLNFNHRI